MLASSLHQLVEAAKRVVIADAALQRVAAREVKDGEVATSSESSNNGIGIERSQ